jgi:DNA-binding CsgD family transcriptional regulator
VAAVPMGEAEAGTLRVRDRSGRGAGTVLTGLVLVCGLVSLLRRAPLTKRRTVSRPRTRLETLSPYQRRVLHLMATGMSNLAIAAELGVSRRAIENQVSRLMQALGLGRDNDALAARVCAVLMYLRETRPQQDAVEHAGEPVPAVEQGAVRAVPAVERVTAEQVTVERAVPAVERVAAERPVPTRVAVPERPELEPPAVERRVPERPAAGWRVPERAAGERRVPEGPVTERPDPEHPVAERPRPERAASGRSRATRSASERAAAGGHTVRPSKTLSHVD